jgi:AAA family ATP:ADP antiporter
MLRNLVDIRAGEGKRTLLALLSLLLVVASYTMVKAVRDALFLSRFGITELSFIAIGLAVLIGFIITLYLRGTAGAPRSWLIGSTNVIVAATLALIWFGMSVPALAAILPWVLYIWSSIFGVFIVMQFWLLANDLFDPREAKRLFGLVSGGAILGGITGGFLSRTLAGLLGTANLLLIAGALLLVEAVLVALLWRLRRREPEPRTRKQAARGGGLGTLRENRVVRLLALALLLATMATTLLDWQFKGIAKAAFANRTDEMAAFFGSLYAYISLASFGIQSLFTAAILRRFGVGVGLLLLPVSLLAGSALILASTVVPQLSRLVAASAAKVAEGGLRFAVDKASVELMWLPVPPAVKERGKAFVDTVMDRLATGMTGLVWLALAAFGLDSPHRIHLISIGVGGIIVLWLIVLVNARREYVRALRDALSQRKIDFGRVPLSLESAETQGTIQELLRSRDPRAVHFACYLLDEAGGPLPDLSGPLAHADPGVRQAALELLARRRDGRHRAVAVGCLSSASDRVREAAIVYLRCTAPPGSDPLVEELARRGEVDAATLNVIWLGIPARAMAAADALRSTYNAGEVEQQATVARLLGAAPPEMAAALLAPALGDLHPSVVLAAVRAAGRARAAGLVPDISRLLADRRFRRSAAEALRAIGDPAVDHLALLARDTDAAPTARQTAIQIIGASRRPDLLPPLLSLVATEGFDISHRALRALNRLRNSAGLELDPAQLARVDELIDAELSTLYRDLLFLGGGSWVDIRQAPLPQPLLERALSERADNHLERIFRLLALRHDPGDLYAAFLGVRSALKSLRASSVEFLDNLLPKNLTRRLLPALESAGAARFASIAGQLEQPAAADRRELLRQLLQGSDHQLQAVAARTAATDAASELAPEIETLAASAVPFVAAEARSALHRLGLTSTKDPEMGLTTIEKALRLQQADVLQQASTEDLVHIAQIATEEEVDAGTALYAAGDAPDGLYVILSGEVRLHRGEDEIAMLGEGETFGGWALVDESPRVASATAVAPTTLLRVGRADFVDLLSDRIDIVQAVLKGMVQRLRGLADVASKP